MPAADCFASVFRDGTHLGVSTDLEKTTGAIADISPQDAAAWRAMLSEFGSEAPQHLRLARGTHALGGGGTKSSGRPGGQRGPAGSMRPHACCLLRRAIFSMRGSRMPSSRQ